jgi:hypothetical protein
MTTPTLRHELNNLCWRLCLTFAVKIALCSRFLLTRQLWIELDRVQVKVLPQYPNFSCDCGAVDAAGFPLGAGLCPPLMASATVCFVSGK